MGNEIEVITGNCMSRIGKVASINNNENERISQMVEMRGVLYFTAGDGVHGSEL